MCVVSAFVILMRARGVYLVQAFRADARSRLATGASVFRMCVCSNLLYLVFQVRSDCHDQLSPTVHLPVCVMHLFASPVVRPHARLVESTPISHLDHRRQSTSGYDQDAEEEEFPLDWPASMGEGGRVGAGADPERSEHNPSPVVSDADDQGGCNVDS
jgi:hypothetical protein